MIGEGHRGVPTPEADGRKKSRISWKILSPLLSLVLLSSWATYAVLLPWLLRLASPHFSYRLDADSRVKHAAAIPLLVQPPVHSAPETDTVATMVQKIYVTYNDVSVTRPLPAWRMRDTRHEGVETRDVTL